jgi:hypothetical protein
MGGSLSELSKRLPTLFYNWKPAGETMEWTRCKPPSQVNACDCGSDVVEELADGLVTRYRCGDCHTNLGDLTMGHEP